MNLLHRHGKFVIVHSRHSEIPPSIHLNAFAIRVWRSSVVRLIWLIFTFFMRAAGSKKSIKNVYVLFFFCKIRPSSNPLKQTPNEIKSEDLGQWMEPLRAIYRPEEFSFRVLLHWSKRMCPTWWWYIPLLVAKGTSCSSPGNWSRNNYRRICRVRRCSKTTAPISWLSMTPRLTFVEKRYCKCVSTLTWRYSCENRSLVRVLLG